jgi:hypothetical protein
VPKRVDASKELGQVQLTMPEIEWEPGTVVVVVATVVVVELVVPHPGINQQVETRSKKTGIILLMLFTVLRFAAGL